MSAPKPWWAVPVRLLALLFCLVFWATLIGVIAS